jgi:predicted dehydrogenase
VSAYSTPVRLEERGFDFPLTTAAVLQMEDGVVGRVTATMEAHMPYVFHMSLQGEEGSARNNRIYSTAFPGATGFMDIPTVMPDSGDVAHHPFQGEIDHIVECIQNDVDSYADIFDSINTHEACLAADISAAEGRPVALPLMG